MSHRLALYRVRVRPKRERDTYKPLGDIDDGGTWLGDVIDKALTNLRGKSRDGKVEARADGPLPGVGPTQVGAAVVSGRSGVISRIEKHGEEPFLRTSDHMEAMRSAVLFDLPRASDAGYMLVHVPHARGCKAIIEDVISTAVRNIGCVLELGPVVPQSALLAAVRENGLEQVILIKYDPVSSDAFNQASIWGDEVDRLELRTTGRRRHRLRGDPVEQFLDDPSEENRRRLIEFHGLTFDEIAVTVELQNGARRTFNLDRSGSGYPMTMAIDVEPWESDDLGATAEALSREMCEALADVIARP